MTTAQATCARPAFDGRPLLKWVGGKKRLLSTLAPHYTGQARIVEPFFGGGALSFHLAAAHPTLQVRANDALPGLVGIYTAVRDDAEGFLADVDSYALPYLAADGKAARRAFYYQTRNRYMTGDIDGPAPLFFMLWTAYSGLYRTGKAHPGRFSTSHGFGAEKPDFYHRDRVLGAAARMADWTFSSADFADTLDDVDADTLVFLDPPYRGTFTGYTGDGFTDADQHRVAAYFHAAADKGATVVYTNKDTGDGWYEAAFPGARITRVPIRYSVNANCATAGREQTHEVIIATR